MRSLHILCFKLIACFFWVGVTNTAHAQLTENVNECGELEREAYQGIPLSKHERIALRQKEIDDLVDQVETCSKKSGQGEGEGSSSGNGSGVSNGDGFGNSLEQGQHSVASNVPKGSKMPAIETSMEPSNRPEDNYVLVSDSQDANSENGANQETLKKVDNNERLRRQLKARIDIEKDPAVRAALEEKLKNLEK